MEDLADGRAAAAGVGLPAAEVASGAAEVSPAVEAAPAAAVRAAVGEL